MNQSNIFVLIELSKLTASLTTNALLSKQHLKAQAGYFNIIPAKYFSDALSPEWESIVEQLKQKGPKVDQNGKILTNAVINTLEEMSQQQCVEIAVRIMTLHQKVALEFR